MAATHSAADSADQKVHQVHQVHQAQAAIHSAEDLTIHSVAEDSAELKVQTDLVL